MQEHQPTPDRSPLQSAGLAGSERRRGCHATVVTKGRYNVLAPRRHFEWYATAHDGPDPELARLHGDRPGFMFDVGSSTGLGTSMTKRSGKGDRLARPNATNEYWP